MRVIPAIDVQGGNCVRLLQGDFAQSTTYSDDPAAVAHTFAELQTQDLHVVDLDGARSGSQQNRSIIADIAGVTDMAVQVGGGIRKRDDVSRWLDAGISRCVIGSLAVTEPDLVKAWLAQFGGHRIVLALDVNVDEDGTPLITTHGWTRPSNTTLYECIGDFAGHGLQHVLCTDVSRDGALAGPNLELYADILQRFPDLQLQASGGVRHLQDLAALRDQNVPAAITGRALLDGRLTAAEVVAFQQDA